MKQGEKTKYFATDQHEDVLEIVIYGDITSWEWLDSDVSSYTLSKLITETDAAHIRVRINSYGGEVAEGLAIYNALKNHKHRSLRYVMGLPAPLQASYLWRVTQG